MLSRENASHLPMKQRTTYGCDPGSMNMGFAGAFCKGLLRLRQADGELLKDAIPDVVPLRLERWNLKQGQVLTHDADWNPMLIQLEGFSGEKSEDFDSWRRALAACVKRVGPLFDLDEHNQLPVMVTENQCDIAKEDKHTAQMYRLADQVKTVIDFEDQLRNLPRRVNRYSNCKYMMRNDKSLPQREMRKERSVEITFELLGFLQLAGPLKYLQTLKDRGEKIDDICDAFLLAVQDQLDCMCDEAKALVREAREFIKLIPVKPTVKRQRKALLKPLSEKEISERIEKGLPLVDPTPQPKAKKTVTKPRKTVQRCPPKPKPKAKKRGRKSKAQESSSSSSEDEDDDDTVNEDDFFELTMIPKDDFLTHSTVSTGPILLREESWGDMNVD
jgi:hypothetical protein